MTTIKLQDYTELEQKFIKAGVEEFNDLMFTDELNHGIPERSLGGVVASLSNKGVITSFTHNGIGEFTFNNDRGEPDWDDAPELI